MEAHYRGALSTKGNGLYHRTMNPVLIVVVVVKNQSKPSRHVTGSGTGAVMT